MGLLQNKSKSNVLITIMHYFQQSNKLLASQFSRNEWTRTMEQIEKQTPEIIDEYITLVKHPWGTNRK